MLGCQNKTYWCVTKGYKDNACNHSRPYESLCYNHFHITTEDAIKNKYKNIVIFEDDFTIKSNIWKDYNERKVLKC